jgi:hypothetical protein
MPDDIHFDGSARQKKNRRGYGSRARFRRQLKEAGASTYAEYLQSDHWRALKASWVPRRTWQRKPVCELCLGRVGPFQLHHKVQSDRLRATGAFDPDLPRLPPVDTRLA